METQGSETVTFASSPVVNTVFDTILADVHSGRLQPGERISDAQIAETLGVSRTPVREAIQRLREIGIVEASASRFTRIAIVSPVQTAQALIVWVALYQALVDEVVEQVEPSVLEAMSADHGQFLAALKLRDPQEIARTNADFFTHLVLLSENPALQKAITAVVHQVRLGSLHLPAYIDLPALAQSQALLIAASRDHDTAAARGAIRMISLIKVPTEG
jgi:DNA-binding GntR family transcriptional regulator